MTPDIIMTDITTNIATQGHFGKASDSIVAISTQGHFLSLVNVLSQTISITRRDGGVTITKRGGGITIQS